MIIDTSSPSDLDELVKLYELARLQMINTGNPNQWVDGYPSPDLISSDIQSGCLYVCRDNDELVAAFVLSESEDPSYNVIYDGDWRNEDTYAVIHRLAVSTSGRGIGQRCVDWCVDRYSNIKVDTHSDNLPMQRLLEKNGFERCGTIRNTWGAIRVAYHGVFD
ncbi:GNAT family N-acetyltransferase [Thalassolituus maritimus]|uniref:GNAT family N-acetyltransferase n=1 Tax=Thalassolituus maritimus TaxID=484498 RepID=A0ABP9ZZK6_9GAMM